jgi:hypothetical protein
MHAPFNRAFNEPGLLQHFEVIRDCGLCGTEVSAELAGAASLTARKDMNH